MEYIERLEDGQMIHLTSVPLSDFIYDHISGVGNSGPCMFYIFLCFNTPHSVIELPLHVLRRPINSLFIQIICAVAEKQVKHEG